MNIKIIEAEKGLIVADTDVLVPGDILNSGNGWIHISTPPNPIDRYFRYRVTGEWNHHTAPAYTWSLSPRCGETKLVDFEFKPDNRPYMAEYERKMEQVNYVQVEEGSQHYTDLAQLLQTMKHLHKRISLYLLKKDQPYSWDGITDEEPHKTSAEEDVAYIIKGLENSIKAGYKIVDPAPEGMMTIHVPVDSYILPAEEREKAQDSAVENLAESIIQAINDGDLWGYTDPRRPKNNKRNAEMLKTALKTFLNIK